MLLFGLPSAQAISILAIAEHVQLVKRRITCLIGNSFRIHGFDEALGRSAGEVFLVRPQNLQAGEFIRVGGGLGGECHRSCHRMK